MERYLRRVNALDKKLIFDWANDPETRANSFNQEPISYEEHEKWFDASLNNENRLMYVMMDFMKPLGQIRVDLSEDGNSGVISYSIAPDVRGLGLGKEEIRLIEEKMRREKGKEFTLIAFVKPENEGSNRIFSSLGYTYYDDGSYRKVLGEKQQEKLIKEKDQGFEILRVISMMMVIVLHYLQKGGLIENVANDMSATNLGFWFLESLCLCCVNVYVLISGYYMVKSRFTLSKVVRIWGQVFFYSVLVTLIMVCLGQTDYHEVLNLYNICYLGLPVSMGHYWFATAYVFMLLLSPVLAMAACKMTKRQLEMVVILLLSVFCFIKSLLPFDTPYDQHGYDLVWFICLFMFAAYVRLHGFSFIKSKIGAAGLYLVSSLLIWIWLVTAGIINIQSNFSNIHLIDRTSDYNFIFVFSAAVGLFLLFKDFKPVDNPVVKYIVRIAPYTFGVYLLHEHIFMAHKWVKYLKVDGEYGLLRPVHIVLSVILVFGIGILVDFVRRLIFTGIGKLANWALVIYYDKREIFDYLIFGVLATVVNWIAYLLASRLYLAYFFADEKYATFVSMTSNVLAWVAAVIFAYWTNRNFVFRSENNGFAAIVREFITFIAARVTTFLIELALLFVCLTLLHMYDLVAKAAISIVVIVLNYVFSKLFIFKKKAETK